MNKFIKISQFKYISCIALQRAYVTLFCRRVIRFRFIYEKRLYYARNI